ncbi:MAG: TlpA family protein disulfide reductase [Ignavibacteriae bacterium]|nr:TlpA family protein disulfide reductase [Ignavibacteriota bacterium]
MYKVIIFIFALILPASVFSKTINGRLLGYNNQPISLSHISYEENGKQKSIQVNNDGTFRLEVNENYFVEIEFTGVDHQSYKKKILFPYELKPIDITIKLTPNQMPKVFNKIIAIGNFNEYNWDSGFIEFKENSDSIYTATLNPGSDTLLYQVIFDTGKNNRRSYNGHQSDFYVYDGGGDYRSGILTNKKEIKLSLDLKKYPKGKFNPEIISVDENVNFALSLENQLEDIRFSHLADRSKVVMNYKEYTNVDSVIASLKKMYLDSVKSIVNTIKERNFRFYCLLTYIDIASDGMNVENASDVIDKNLILELKAYMPPESDFLDKPRYGSFPLYISRILEKDYTNSEYLQKIIDLHNAESTAWMVLYVIRYSDRLKDSAGIKKFYDIMDNKFSNTKQATYAHNEFSKDKRIVVGKQIPEFKFANLDNPKDTITPSKLKGKYVLFDIWGTWCGPCLMEMKYLDSAYKTFKDKNFTIYSHAVDNGSKVVQNFRKNKWPMPWLHSLADGAWDSEQVKLFEVVGVPKTFLVDPDGKIIETDKLRQEKLIETLSKYLK